MARDRDDSGTPHRAAPEAPGDSLEREFARRLAAFDDALARGAPDSHKEEESSAKADSAWLAELHEAKRCLRLLEQVWPRTSSPDSPTPSHSGPEPISHDGENGALRFGRFLILRRLGSGGGGIVYLAKDPQLDRFVAVKVPRLEFVFTPSMQQRFLREAQAAAALSHPHIVPVFESGREGLICYIVSAYCRGTNLAAWLNQRQKAVDAKSAARLVAVLADTVHYAHRWGVLHRDLKPSNVLLEFLEPTPSHEQPSYSTEARPHLELAQFVPKLTDFGLAKLLENSGDDTRTGVVLGTPAYMAPEQAEGRIHEIGPPTDVYALGVILYHLLVGRPPFGGTSDLQTLSQIMRDPPRPVRAYQRHVSRDLDAICLKCLEKEPGSRYPSAADLAADLRRYLAGQPTIAQPPSWGLRVLKWSQRRPALAALLVVSVLFLMTLMAGATWHVLTINRVREITDQVQQVAEESGRRNQRHDYATWIQAAYQAWQNADIQAARELLARCCPLPGQNDPRDFEWYYVRRLCDGGLRTLTGHQGRVRGVTFHPDGRVLASGAECGWLRLWDSGTGKTIAELDCDGRRVLAVRYSPDGRLLAAALSDGTVRLWDPATGQLRSILEGHAGAVSGLAFCPDGSRLATAGADHTVHVWEVETGQQELILRGHSDSVYAVAFGHDRHTLVSGGEDGRIQIWDLRTPTSPVRTLEDTNPVYAVAISPDGRKLAAAGLLRVWELNEESREPTVLAGHQNSVHAIVFSADGSTVISAGDDKSVRVWDCESGRTRYVFHGHLSSIYDIALSSQEHLIATASGDETVKLWDPRCPQDRRPLRISAGCDVLAAFSPRAPKLAYASHWKGEVRVAIWHVPEGLPTEGFRRPAGVNSTYFSSRAFSPDGIYLAVACLPGPVLLWNTQSQQVVRQFGASSDHPSRCRFSADGRRLIVAGIRPAQVCIYDVQSGAELAQMPGVRCATFSRDGRIVAMESRQSLYAVELWDWTRNRSIAILPGHTGEIYQMEFSADGRLLATVSEDGTARLWDVTARELRLTMRGHTDAIYDVSFCPHGQSLATAGTDGTLNFWDLDTGGLRLSLQVGAGQVRSIAFSADGAFLATALSRGAQGGRVDLWEAFDPEEDNERQKTVGDSSL